MGVMRLPRPMGVYVPSSPTSSLTSNMISSPLSPSFNFDSETLTPSVLPALEYISSKLQQKMMHVTLLVGRGKPYPTGEPSDLIVIPITTLDAQEWRTVYRTIAKGASKFSLGQSWPDAFTRSQYERKANDYLVQQSIMQNEVVFSREGLTLLNVDRIYTFKRRLCILSTRGKPTHDSYITSCVQLLHRTIEDCHGRPFSKAFFHRVYEQLDVHDDILARVAAAYQKQYGEEGIVLPPRPKVEQQTTTTAATRKVAKYSTALRARRDPLPSKFRPVVTKRAPKTPLSASDVTPITRNEWKMLVGTDFAHTKPTVTKWTPSPIVLTAA
ncbi:hypothetical protein BDW42DRAFT_166788 [Aspergillus taichungensis]|uniref:DUF7582 domain-containing protein n=1 Tax=Aspergillus taichungensis TaxID=482145 RepID=A0A2J5HYM8_9EURO|nr:hypothetical protein BDW42DRAFT_166788 [Aspergillus taichungensis]